MSIQIGAEIWIVMAVTWGLLAGLLIYLVRREPGEVRRRWRELTEASRRSGGIVDVVGPQGELLEQVSMPPEGAAPRSGEDGGIDEEQRTQIVQRIKRDATWSSLIFLFAVAFVVVALVFGPFGAADVPSPHVAAGVMFLLGGTACTYFLNFYSGALEALENAFFESYLVNQGGGIYLWALLGTIPAALFGAGAAGLAWIDTAFTLAWSPGWAGVYAATGALHAATCWWLSSNEPVLGQSGSGQGPSGTEKVGTSVPVMLALFLGMPLVLPAVLHSIGLAAGAILRLAG
jgi:hypothetical protein